MFLKKVSKHIVFGLISICLVTSIVFEKSFANTVETIEKSDTMSLNVPMGFQSELTIREIEMVFQDYLVKNNIDIIFGTEEYLDYIYSQMLDETDRGLIEHPEYNIIRAYFAEYIASIQGFEINSSGEYFTIDDIENIDKTISEIRAINISEDIKLDETSEETRLAGYNKYNARDYARKWSNSYNTKYNYYSADCTNFISQCLEAGSLRQVKPSTVPNGTLGTTKYWYSVKPKVSTPWIRVTDFHSFWAPKVPDANYAGDTTVSKNGDIGDVVQFRYAGTLTRWHTMIITSKVNGVVRLTGHTKNREDYPISNYDDNAYDWSLLDFNY